MPWAYVKECIDRADLHLLARTESCTLRYHQFSHGIRKEYASMADYILAKIFRYETEEVDGKKKALAPLDMETPQVHFVPNDFPYDFEDPIEHHVLWCTEPLSPDVIAAAIREHRPGYECLYFINFTHLQSIKEIHHAHILSRRS